jgi:hypothetical protein
MNYFASVPLKQRFSRKQAFVGLFGVSLVAFGAGFSDCLFDIDRADACVAHAESWIEPFQKIGDHLIEWVAAILQAVF